MSDDAYEISGAFDVEETSGDRLFALYPSREGDVATEVVRTRPDGTRVWTATFRHLENRTGVETDEYCHLRELALDRSGNAWLALAARLGGCALDGVTLRDGDYLLKLDGAGRVADVRNFFFGTEGHALLWSIDVDGAGNVAVAGQFMGRVDLGAGALDSGDGYDGYVASYGPDLQLRWAHVFGGPTGSGHASDVATNPSGEVLVGGAIDGAATFGGSAVAGTGPRGFLGRIDPLGRPRWSRTVGRSVEHVVVSHLGTAVAAGTGEGVQWARTTTTGSTFLVTAELNGAERWAKGYSISVLDLTVDPEGALRLLAEADPQIDFGGGRGTGDGPSAALVKIGLDGNHRWTQRFSIPVDYWSAGSPVRTDAAGKAWLFGTYTGTATFGSHRHDLDNRWRALLVEFDR